MIPRVRLLGPLIPLLLIAPLLSACTDRSTSSRAESERRLVLGFSPVVSWGGWSGANADSVRNSAHESGMDVLMEDTHYRQENQVATLRSFVRERVDVIVFAPVVETGWDLVLREIRSAGIPVILMDRNIEVNDTSLYVSHVGSDFVEEGRRAGRWLVEHTKEEPGEIAILELRGSEGAAPANDRKLGFAQAIAGDSRYRIVESRSGDFFRARARVITANYLSGKDHRVRVIFAHNDGMALGGIDALEAAGLKPGTDVLVISVEGSREGLEAIVAGKLNVSVECNPLLGPQLIAVARDAALGKQVPRRVITQETVFTRENAAAELPKRAY
jgi:simple sugar transport system substrate-binding protein